MSQVSTMNTEVKGIRTSVLTAVSEETAIWWLFRMFVCWEYIGHGAFGVITKEGWLPYFNSMGISSEIGWKLMPIVGTLDIFMGLSALFIPMKGYLVYMAVWGFFTAWLRPLAGESISEVFERSYNFGVPLAMLMFMNMTAKSHGLFERITEVPKLTKEAAQKFVKMFKWIIASYMVGHGAFGVIDNKMGLMKLYDGSGLSAFFGSTQNAMMGLGLAEVGLGLLVLFWSPALLLVFIALWKIATEMLFPVAGAFYGGFEFMERGCSYAAPFILLFLQRYVARTESEEKES